MNDTIRCQSCSMTIESGTYCEHCTDEHGNLQSFPERLERFTQWISSQDQTLPKARARERALAIMATMPAWVDHPELIRERDGDRQ